MVDETFEHEPDIGNEWGDQLPEIITTNPMNIGLKNSLRYSIQIYDSILSELNAQFTQDIEE